MSTRRYSTSGSFNLYNHKRIAVVSDNYCEQIKRHSKYKCSRIMILQSSFNFAGAGSTIAPMASPFSSSPGTSTGQAITNFNVLLSGVQLYAHNYNYSI